MCGGGRSWGRRGVESVANTCELGLPCPSVGALPWRVETVLHVKAISFATRSLVAVDHGVGEDLPAGWAHSPDTPLVGPHGRLPSQGMSAP